MTGPGKILIVDDDRFVRMALSEALRSWEYEIVEADTVKSAKTALTEEEPEIVLLDIDLPDGQAYTKKRKCMSKTHKSKKYLGREKTKDSVWLTENRGNGITIAARPSLAA